MYIRVRRRCTKYPVTKRASGLGCLSKRCGLLSLQLSALGPSEQRGIIPGQNAKSAQPSNREWAAAIQEVTALGWAIPPVPSSSWPRNTTSRTGTPSGNLPGDWAHHNHRQWLDQQCSDLDWIKQFEGHYHTASRTMGKYRLFDPRWPRQPSTRPEFEFYCQHNKIITLCYCSASTVPSCGFYQRCNGAN